MIYRENVDEMSRNLKITNKEKRQLRNQLYERDGRTCHYCGIAEGEFTIIWGQRFYGGIKRGQILEIDRKGNNLEYNLANCVLACAICNMAKSDKFTYDEFKKVGDIIRAVWGKRQNSSNL